MIRADALAIHLNFLEEAVMPEGDRSVEGLRQALAAAVESAPVPLIAKETGAGLARAAALELRALGFRALDVGGLGGTSFAPSRASERPSRATSAGGEWAKCSGIGACRPRSAWSPPLARACR